MRFELIDAILEQSDDRIVAVKQVSLAEEYLADHFPSFPILPGVMMLETFVQAARIMLADRGDRRLVLGRVLLARQQDLPVVLHDCLQRADGFLATDE